MSEEGFWDVIRENPRDATTQVIFLDWLKENKDQRDVDAAGYVFNALNTPGDANAQRQALHTAAGEGHLRGLPLEALPAIVELFDIGLKKNETAEQRHARGLRYADYLDIAAAVTRTDRSDQPVSGEGADKHFDASRCTRLQAEYLRGCLAGGANAGALLAGIRTELRKIPGLGALPDERIPANRGRISLDAHETGITALPEGLHIGGYADFWGCGKLTGASHIHMGGDADFRYCRALTKAGHIHAGWNATFWDCGALTEASHIHAVGNADFRGCGALTGVSHIHAGGHADFERCGALTRASHIHAGEYADFERCWALTEASHIHARQYAIFQNCGALKTLGAGCRIGGDLYLTRSGVTGLPKDIVIDKGIKDIPASFTTENLTAALDYKDISVTGRDDIRAELGRRPKERTGSNDLVENKSTREIT